MSFLGFKLFKVQNFEPIGGIEKERFSRTKKGQKPKQTAWINQKDASLEFNFAGRFNRSVFVYRQWREANDLRSSLS